ncbi:MAG: threonine ammonia-lyase [Actinobacteria bacterium]|nr:threonine ammonia-lyase [Actinomycetota bacterium]
MTVSIRDIEAAEARLGGVIRLFPPVRARWLEDLVGGPVFLFTENLQRAGSFKIRGAYNFIAQLSDDQKSRGVVAASAGNHAQGVALAASMLGVPATVFMPEEASIPKVQATRDYGADVRFAGSTIDESVEAALEFAKATGAVLVHPYDSENIVAGQGTLGLEMAASVPDLHTAVVCTGGGGLLAGITIALADRAPNVRVVGAQATTAAAYPASLAAGHPVRLEQMATMADGIAVGLPGEVPFGVIAEHRIPIVTVSEDEISRAVVMLLERSKLLVEPGGAAATAAVMSNPGAYEPPVAITLSGGNVDSLVLMRILRHGLAAAERFLTLVVRAPDRPGSLARLLNEIQRMRANVVDVDHNRLDPSLGVDEVEIVVDVETRGPAHAAEVVAALSSAGFTLTSIE